MKRSFFLLAALWLAVSLAGCESSPKSYTKNEADESFLRIMKNEFSYNVKTFWAKDTLWIYLPIEDAALYKIAAGQKTPPTEKKFSLEFFDGTFKENSFVFEYDIINATKVGGGAGLSTRPTDEFNTYYRNIITGISRSYFSADKPPEFIVLVLADIKNGMEAEQTIYLLDLKKYFSYALPPDEYSMRALTETRGDAKITGDTEGRHLHPTAVTWSDFLTRQVTQRVRSKFQNSELPENETAKGIILKMTAMTMMTYDYENYGGVILNDLRAKQTETFTRAQIKALEDKSMLGQKKAIPEGKIITIDFSDLGKTPAEGAGHDTSEAETLPQQPADDQTPQVSVQVQPENLPAEKQQDSSQEKPQDQPL